jgi:hypothetical protein
MADYEDNKVDLANETQKNDEITLVLLHIHI